MKIQDKVVEMIAEFLEIEKEEVVLTADLREDLGADSLDFAELVMELEDEFDFEANEAELANLKTVGDVVTYMEKQ